MSLPGQPPRFPQQPPRPRYPQPSQGGFRQPAQARPNWGHQPPARRPGPAGYRPVPGSVPGYRPMPPAQQQWRAPAGNFGRNQQWSTPAKQGNGCGAACGLVAIAGIGFLIFIGLVMGALVNDPNPTPSSSSSRPVASSSKSRASKPSSSSSRSAPPSVASTQRSHPAGNYQNDGYRAPGFDPNYPGPKINSPEHGDQVSKTNPIYRLNLNKPVRCELDVLDYSKASNEQRRQHLVYVRDCYLRVWGPLVEQAGFTMITPEVYIANHKTQTPCGDAGSPTTLAFYCSANQSIYMMVDRYSTVKSANGAIQPHFESTFAHEFGHHIQYRTGILNGSWWVVYDRDQEAKNYRSRRIELQTQCFAGMTFQGVRHSMGFSDYDMQHIYERESNKGDSVTHGSSRLRGVWFRHGTEHARIGECNTFMANPQMVDT